MGYDRYHLLAITDPLVHNSSLSRKMRISTTKTFDIVLPSTLLAMSTRLAKHRMLLIIYATKVLKYNVSLEYMLVNM